MTPLSYHSSNLSLIALETMRLLVQIHAQSHVNTKNDIHLIHKNINTSKHILNNDLVSLLMTVIEKVGHTFKCNLYECKTSL